MSQTCILCQTVSPLFFTDGKSSPARNYYHCPNCNMRFIDSLHYLSQSDEKARYLEHENNPQDEGYRNYLAPAAQAIEMILPSLPASNLKVLDFGCGQHSALADLLKSLPLKYFSYDPYFKNDAQILNDTYNIIVATEVIEHLSAPAQILLRLKNMISSDGYIIFMTQFYSPNIDFKTWHYRRDPTHIAFYSKETMQFIKEKFSFTELNFTHPRVASFKL